MSIAAPYCIAYNFRVILAFKKQRLSAVPEVWGSNLGQVKSNKVLPTALHCCDISSEGSVLPWHNDAKMNPTNSLVTVA